MISVSSPLNMHLPWRCKQLLCFAALVGAMGSIASAEPVNGWKRLLAACVDGRRTCLTGGAPLLRRFTHASPTLFNAGTPRPQLSSCFLICSKDDSIEVGVTLASPAEGCFQMPTACW